jgi:hypothetical protein
MSGGLHLFPFCQPVDISGTSGGTVATISFPDQSLQRFSPKLIGY